MWGKKIFDPRMGSLHISEDGMDESEMRNETIELSSASVLSLDIANENHIALLVSYS